MKRRGGLTLCLALLLIVLGVLPVAGEGDASGIEARADRVL
jgi:hypothetical protein